MRREDVIEILERIPEHDLTKTQLIMPTGMMLSVDTIIRYEPTFLVMRGREGGNQDEARGFFLPFAEIQYIKIERQMQIAELDAVFGDRPDSFMKRNAAKPKTETQSDGILETPKPSAPMDPAAIAKQNLLDRIRAAKSVTSKPTGKL
jgi:hypothetical protein